MTTPWPVVGPPARDELSAWTDAVLSDAPLGPAHDYVDASPPGRVHLVDGRGVFVRRTESTSSSPAQLWGIHGLGGFSGNWDRLGAALSPYATTWAPDLPGSGRSEPPPGRRYSLVGEADLVADLIARLSPGPVHLAGNSRGGLVATYLAARHPELVRTLTLVSPAVPDLRPTLDRGADPRIALVMLPGVPGRVEQRLSGIDPRQRAVGLAQLCFGEPEKLTEGDLAVAESEFRLRAGLPWTNAAMLASLRSLIRAQLRPGPWSFTAAAHRVRVPTLIIWGTRDRLVDVRLSRRTAAAFSDSRLLVLAGSGHVSQMERPMETARAMLGLWNSAPGAPQPSSRRAVARWRS
jgi:pimeloyl-ACP methyl ester carboxylesterase